MIKGKNNKLYEVISNTTGSILWINSEDGSCVARFNTTMGIDIHNSARDQFSGKSECLWCTHKKPSYSEWLVFIKKVKEHFGFQLSIDSVDVGLLE